jgi:O-antigen/teichoic acid export membrane protein
VLYAAYIPALVINILANALFVPKFGYNASAWITVLSECFVCVVLIFQWRGEPKNSSIG